MMRSIIGILLTAFILTILGCTKTTWDDHYKQPETVNMNVWDAVKSRSELSRFVELMVKYKYDTLFKSNNTYTLFIPDNNAIDKLMQSQDIGVTILNYHISQHFIQPVDLQGKRKLQTLAEKFSTFENVNGKSTYDGVPLTFESPLYLNGKFFIMGEVALPKMNLYEFFALNNPFFKSYIDKKDSIVLDKAKSRPIGFDAKGNTVYDTVSIKINMVDSLYFPVHKEFRVWTATFVYPKQSTYENGLTAMAQKLGGSYHDYNDIPVPWQEKILIPFLLNHGTFLNMLDPSDFKTIAVLTKKKKFNMVNIKGDSIIVNYVPTDRYLCSNGVTYDYANFVIPDTLFMTAPKMEGEWLARPTGANKYTWRNNVSVTSSSFFDVANDFISTASNDSILKVNFTKGYKGTFNLQFQARDLFPRRYRMVISTFMDIGGAYDIYVNGVQVKRNTTDVNSFNYYEFVKSRGVISSVAGTTFVPVGRYNKFDFYVDNITDYGRPTIRFEYKGPGTSVPNNGLVLDVIEFIPVP